MALAGEEWTQYKDVMTLYIDSAKTFASLSSAALALTIVFRQQVIGVKPAEHIANTMVASWAFFLFAIMASAFYQYFAIKLLDSNSLAPGTAGPFAGIEPGWIYATMAAAFLVASTLLVLAAWSQLTALTP